MNPSPSEVDVVFEQASLLCYRLHDIADEIDLDAASRLLSEGLRPFRLTREGSQYIELPRPPIGFSAGRRKISLPSGEVEVELEVRLFDFGAASVQVSVPVRPGTTLGALSAQADEVYDGAAIDALCFEVVDSLRARIGAALQGPHRSGPIEGYTIVFAQALRGIDTASELLERVDLSRLLLGEPPSVRLSRAEREAVTSCQFSYTEQDLVVVDWNAAFVWEPNDSRDIPLLLELVNAQLLELRYYDALLEARLQETYEDMGRRRRGLLLFRSPYQRLARRTLSTVLELQEFIERAENSIKVIGDVYLAKVYEASAQQLRLPSWQNSVTRKQELLARTYGLLKGEVDTDRALLLEATIVLLIVLEIVMAFLKVMS